jgi:hypothetical protein
MAMMVLGHLFGVGYGLLICYMLFARHGRHCFADFGHLAVEVRDTVARFIPCDCSLWSLRMSRPAFDLHISFQIPSQLIPNTVKE